MSLVLVVLLLAIGWAAATGSFSLPTLLFGGVIGAVALFLVRDHVRSPGIWRKLRRIAALAGLFVYELFLSAIKVAALVVRPDMHRHLSSAIVAFPLTATRDAEITLLANLITLTPGTLSVDVSEDRRFLYVHAINCPDRDALVRDIAKGFEAKIIEVFE